MAGADLEAGEVSLVEHATRRVRGGQRIRVHGTEGYVEILA
jgi:hypothetical protein